MINIFCSNVGLRLIEAISSKRLDYCLNFPPKVRSHDFFYKNLVHSNFLLYLCSQI